MVEIGCGTCDLALERVPSDAPAGAERSVGAYPVEVLACPRCGAAWRQGATGVLVPV